MKTWAARITWASAASSATLFILSIALAAHVRLGLGHWPRPMWEDCDSVAFRMHFHAVVWLAMYAMFAALPVGGIFVLVPRLRLSWRQHFMQIALYATGWILLAAFLISDPYQVVTWFRD